MHYYISPLNFFLETLQIERHKSKVVAALLVGCGLPGVAVPGLWPLLIVGASLLVGDFAESPINQKLDDDYPEALPPGAQRRAIAGASYRAQEQMFAEIDNFDDAPAHATTTVLEPPQPKRGETTARPPAPPTPSPWDDKEAEETMDAIARSFGSPSPVTTMERQFQAVKQEIEQEEKTVKNAKTAISRILAAPYTSRFFVGAQRSGKSYLAAMAAAEMDINVYHLNLASNLGNAGDTEDSRYWRNVKASVCCKLKRLDSSEAAQKIAEAIDVFWQFEEDTSPALLIVDEWAEMGSLYNRHSALLAELTTLLANECSSLSSTGTKQRKAIWAIAPEIVAGNLVQPAKAVKALKLCYVTVPPGRSLDWQGNAVRFSEELFEQVRVNFKAVEHPGSMWREDRIAWIEGDWLPVGGDAKL